MDVGILFLRIEKKMSSMKKIVIIGANEFQNRLILKAKEMGYETHVFAWQDGSIGESTADYFYPISITEKDLILEECKKIKPIAVTSIASDLAVVTVNYVAEQLGLVCNGTDTTLFTTNKFEMRKQLRKYNLPVPHFGIVESYTQAKDLNMKYPLIVKPTDRSGSRGVTKVTNDKELEEAVDYATSYAFEKKAIVEEYLSGEEFSCECISYKGEHHLLAITKKYTTGAPHFIETGHKEPAGLSKEMYERVEEIIKKSLDVLCIVNGASHPEIKIDSNGKIGIIEIGARMGGDCIGSDLVFLSTGYDFLKMVIQTASGEEPDLERKHESQCACIRFLFNHSDVTRMDAFRNDIYRMSIESEEEHAVVDSSTRLGYYIVVGDEKMMDRVLVDEE